MYILESKKIEDAYRKMYAKEVKESTTVAESDKEGSDKSKKKEVFTVHGFNITKDEGADDMQCCGQIYHDASEAYEAAKKAAIDYKDDEDVLNFTVFGGEFEDEEGNITGDGDTDLFSVSNKDEKTTADARKAAGYASEKVDAYVVDGKVVEG